MAEPRRNVANDPENEELINDSADEVDIDSLPDDNAMVTDSDDDEGVANPNIAVQLNIPGQDHVNNMVQNPDDIHHNEPMNYPDNDAAVALDNNIIEDFSDEAISDSEDEVADVPDDEVQDSDDDSHNDDPADSDVDDDDDAVFINDFQETFAINVEAEGLDVQLVARGDTLAAIEKFVIIVAKTLRFRECYKSMMINFKLANLEFNNANFPREMRQFWNVVNRRNRDFRNIVVCTKCFDELGEGKKPVRDCRCGECGPRRTNAELGSYLYINIQSQIRTLLNKPGIAADLQYPYTRRKRHINAIEDVYDGSEYRRLSQEGQFFGRERNNYSLAMWTDGVSPVISSKVTIWPVFLQVLELSPRARQRNSLLAAVYVGPCKPDMNQFLLPVTTALRDLELHGVSWRPDGNVEVISRFKTLILSADSEGRYDVVGMTRHNGGYGCTFCYVDGERIGNAPPIYHYNDGARDRTDEEIREDAVRAHELNDPQRSVRGVRRVSALSVIPGFDLRVGQLVESMHCLWEGNFVRLFNNLTSPDNANSINERQLTTISRRITAIRTPTKLSRLPRDLSRFRKFTATEYRNMALYYWLPCAQDFMDANRLRLCAIFAEATFLLNKDSILPDELDRAEELINTYRRNFEEYFPRNQLTYNVHLLKHLVRCVRELGPLWVASGFWFESLNRQVVNYLTSPTDRAGQVACRMLLGQMLEKCLDWNFSPEINNLLRELIGKETWDNPPNIATGRFVRDDGRDNVSFFQRQEMIALTEAGFENVNPDDPILRNSRVLIDGIKYQPRNDRIVKYNNSIAYVDAVYRGEEVNFVEIRAIVTWNNGERRGVFGTRFSNARPAFNTSYMRIVEESEDLLYIPLSNIILPAVLVRSCGQIYISRLANRWDND